MVVIAAVGRGVTGRVGAGGVAVIDGDAEFPAGEPAEFGDVEGVPSLVGDEPVEQGAGLGGELADVVGGRLAQPSHVERPARSARSS